MAKIRGGALVGEISGSIGSTVFSHNRGGAYIRNRSIPTTVTSAAALAAKAFLASASSAYASLTAAQKLSWQSWADNNPIFDSFGEKRILSGHQAYVQINRRILQAGDTQLADPPLGVAPDGLTTLTGTWDIGAGSFELAFAPTPLAANQRMWTQAAVVNSAGIKYVSNLLRLVEISSAAQATGYDIQAAIEARLGTLQVGQYVHVQLAVYDEDTGLLSRPIRTSGVVVTT